MTDKVKILIGTPAYSGMVHMDYLNSILSINQMGIIYSLMMIGNESLITRARNTIISKFHQQREYTHLLFLDGDVQLKGEDLVKLIEHDKDVIGAPVPLKHESKTEKKRYNLGRLLERDGTLCRTDYIGTAVLMLSRKACDSLIEDAISDNRNFSFNPLFNPDPEGSEQYDIFQVGVVDDNYLSEDYWACHKLRQLGFDLFVDVGVAVNHNGMYRF